MEIYHTDKDLYTSTKPVEQIEVKAFAQKLRSACETFVRMQSDVVPTMSITLAYDSDRLPETLQAISLLAEEYNLQEQATLYEKAITVRFSRLG